MEFLTVAVILFLIMDPVGNISSFLNVMKDVPQEKKKQIIIREMLIALALMLVFNFFGEYIFHILDVSEITVRLTAGAILFLAAIKILFPSSDSLRANLPTGEPFITPLAVPLIAGPSLMATIMLFAHLEPSVLTMLGAIGLAWIAALVVLLMADPLKKFLGANGLSAAERLLGMVLVMLAVQCFLTGVQHFVKNC